MAQVRSSISAGLIEAEARGTTYWYFALQALAFSGVLLRRPRESEGRYLGSGGARPMVHSRRLSAVIDAEGSYWSAPCPEWYVHGDYVLDVLAGSHHAQQVASAAREPDSQCGEKLFGTVVGTFRCESFRCRTRSLIRSTSGS